MGRRLFYVNITLQRPHVAVISHVTTVHRPSLRLLNFSFCLKRQKTQSDKINNKDAFISIKTQSVSVYWPSCPLLVGEYFLWEAKNIITELNKRAVTHLVSGFYLVVPQNIPQMCFWKAEVVLRYSPLQSPCHLGGTTPWWCSNRQVTMWKCFTRLALSICHTCPPERSPSAQLQKYQQHAAGLQIVWPPANTPGPAWCGSPPKPAAPACPPGQQGFGQTAEFIA